MNTVFIIILIIVGILQIFLFFKLWGMANNVSKIRRKQEEEDLKQMSVMAAIHGNLGLAQSLMEQSFHNRCSRIYIWGKDDYLRNIRIIIKEHQVHCNRFGLRMPDTTKYEDYELAKELFKTPLKNQYL